MFARQLEGKLVVIEIIPIPIHPIVAGEAVRAEGEQMRLGEGNVHLTMAGLTGVRAEGGDVPMMTVVTGERFPQRREPVAV